MCTAATGVSDERADDTVEHVVDAFLRFASDDNNSWELLFLYPATSSVGRRTRLIIERRLASVMARRGQRNDGHSPHAAVAARLTMTVAMGEAAIRVCRPGWIGLELSAAQIADLFRQPTHAR